MDLLTGDVELTEFEAIDVESIKGVASGANGFPILMMKGLAPVAKGARDCPKCDKVYDADHAGSKCENCGTDLPEAPASKAADDKVDCPTCKGDGKMRGNAMDCPDCDDGKVTPAKAKTLTAKALVKAIVGKKVDEGPDIAGGTAVIAQIADLIIAEAQELKAGSTGEISDIQQLACAAEMIWCWRTGEEAVASGSVMPATGLMQSAAFIQSVAKGELELNIHGWAPAKVAEFSAMLEVVAKAKHSADDRKKLAEQGNALSDGSYPIADEEDLKSAAILAQSGHGDVDGAKRLITRRAKELGVKNPLEGGGDTTKGAIAQEGADVDTVTQETGGLAKAVEEAVTKAIGPLQERLKSLDAELAKVKATPVPGGPVLSRNVQVKQPGAVASEDHVAKAAYYREQASLWDSQDRATAEGYRLKAREADAKAVTTAS
jgi:hypothetical protein